MKVLLLSLFVFIILILSFRLPIQTPSKGLYKVHKIDSVKNVYLIYAEKSDSIFKIMSIKKKIDNCKRIEVGSSYFFDIVSWFPKDQENIKLRMTGVKFNDTLITIERDSVIGDLFLTKNLKGLCYFEGNK